MKRICSKCGGNGPFPSAGNQCKACDAKRKADWYQKRKATGWKQKPAPYKPERDIPKVLRYKARHPEKYKEFQNKRRKK